MKIFLSYSHKDSDALSYLTTGLNWYIKSKKIDAWNDRYLLAGDVYSPIIKERMEESDIIILLVSYNFMKSDFIMDYEIPIAVDKLKRGARIIPIILEDCPYGFLTDAFGGGINEMPRTSDGNQLKPVSEWKKLAWKIITEQLLRIINNANPNNTGPANVQPAPVIPLEQNGKMLSNTGQSADTDIQHPSQPVKNIFSTSYAVSDSLLTAKSTDPAKEQPANVEKDDFARIFDAILAEGKNSDALQGQITKIRLEDPAIAGIKKKCVVVGALTIALLREYNRERVLMLVDFIEDKEPGLWERALVGLVLSLSGREDLLDMQVKRKLQAFKNDQDIQQSMTNFFYILLLRNITLDENLYSSREAFRNISFFQNQANWFLPFTHEDIPPEFINKNEVFKYADTAILLKDDNIRHLTFLQFDRLTADEQLEMEKNLEQEIALKKKFFGDKMVEEGLKSERTTQNFLDILFSFVYVNYPEEWLDYSGKFTWSDELKELALSDVYLLKDKAMVADASGDKIDTSGYYEDYLAKSGDSDIGALKFYGYYCIFIKDYAKALEKLLAVHQRDPLSVNLNLQIAYSYMSIPGPDYWQAIEYLENAVILDPQNIWCLKNMGICYQMISPPDQNTALDFYLKAYEFEKSDYWLLNRIGACYQQIDKPDFEKSRQFLEMGLRLNEKDFSGQSDLGYAVQQVQYPDFALALGYHMRAFSLDDSNTWNIKNIGYCYTQLPIPNYKKALRYFRIALEDEPNDSWTLFKIAFCNQFGNPPDYSTALEYYLKGYEIDSSKPEIKKNIGICYINKSEPDYQKAIGYLEQALVENPNDKNILANLGYCWQLVESPDYTRALEYHLRAYEIDKDFIWNIKNVGYCYINIPTPDLNEALKYLFLAKEKSENDDWILKRIGYCYQCLEHPDFEKALEYHLQAFEINPSDIWNIQNVAYCYDKLPEPDHHKALEYYLKAESLKADDFINLSNIGICYRNLTPPQHKEALQYFLRSYELNPTDGLILSEIAFCYLDMDPPDYENAYIYFEMASQMGLPPDGIFDMRWGWTSLMLNKLDEAEQQLLKGIELLPEEYSAYVNLGHVEMLRNNHDKAKEYYKTWLSQNKKEEFLEVCRKDYTDLEKLGLSKEVFEKVLSEVVA